MKKTLSIILLIILSTLCGCGNNPNTLESIKAFSALSKKDIAILSTPLSETDNHLKETYAICEELLIAKYYTPTELETEVDNFTPISYPSDTSDLPSVHTIAQALLNPHTNNLNATVKGVEDRFGIDYLRNTEKNGLYSIHMTKEGGYFYMFYDPDPLFETCELGDSRLLATFYVEKKLSQADFTSIKQGSTFDDVKAIDPTVQIYENSYYATQRYRISSFIEQYQWKDTILLDYAATTHYTTDGIIIIRYRFKNGKWKVEEIFNEGFEVVIHSGIRISADGEILDLDLPPQ